MHDNDSRPRRGWRETIEPGLYRAHRVACPSSADKRPGRRCGCPFELKVPGVTPGSVTSVTVVAGIAEARAERRRRLAAGRPKAVATGPETLTDFFATYMRLAERTLAPGTLYTYDECFRLRIHPALGDLSLTEITRERVAAFVNELASQASSTRIVTKTIEALSACLASAVHWGRIPSNPCVDVRADRVRVDADGDKYRGAQERRVLSAPELLQLFAANQNPRILSMLRTAAEAGLRRGELIGLRWPDVDLETGRIQVRRSVWQNRTHGGRKIEKPCKGRAGRVVPIGDSLCRALADWYGISVIERGGPADGYVWPGRHGGPMAADSPSQAVQRALWRANLVDERGDPLVTLHGLRHGCGSLMLMAGAQLIAVSRLLGHADVRVTAEVYAHLVSSDDQLRAACDALSTLLTPAAGEDPVGKAVIEGQNPMA